MSRTATILVLCLLTFASGTLGFGNGMVLVVHPDGLGVEHAHVQHALEHADDADHERHDYTSDVDHAALHAAIVADTDSCPAKPAHERTSHSGKRVTALPVLPAWFALNLPTPPSLSLALMRSDLVLGRTAPTENARLRTVVLII
jgi:hypothetical protein